MRVVVYQNYLKNLSWVDVVITIKKNGSRNPTSQSYAIEYNLQFPQSWSCMIVRLSKIELNWQIKKNIFASFFPKHCFWLKYRLSSKLISRNDSNQNTGNPWSKSKTIPETKKRKFIEKNAKRISAEILFQTAFLFYLKRFPRIF